MRPLPPEREFQKFQSLALLFAAHFTAVVFIIIFIIIIIIIIAILIVNFHRSSLSPLIPHQNLITRAAFIVRGRGRLHHFQLALEAKQALE